MAVGETAGPTRARKIVASSARRRSEETEQEYPTELEEMRPLVAEADEEFERLLEQEEELERVARGQQEVPHFRPGDAD